MYIKISLRQLFVACACTTIFYFELYTVVDEGDDEEQEDGETTANKSQDSIGGNSASGSSYSVSASNVDLQSRYCPSWLGYLDRISCVKHKRQGVQICYVQSYTQCIYCDNTSWDHLPLIIYGSPCFLSRQILFIPPYPQVIQKPPKHPVEPVSFLAIGWVGTSRTSEKIGRQLNDTGGTQAVGTVVLSMQNWVLWIATVSVWVSRELICSGRILTLSELYSKEFHQLYTFIL